MLYRVTIKTSGSINGVRLEKGASVQVSYDSFTATPLQTSQGKQLIADAFMRMYGMDVKKANALSGSYMDVQKVN